MRTVDLEDASKDILRSGPTRVMIDREEAFPPERAKIEFGVIPDVIFLRDDGWSLGAPKHLERVAWAMWSKEWVAFMYNPPSKFQPIKKYRQK